jgi:disulfide oxidoreductase YuzD
MALRFGDRAEISYIDLSDPEARHDRAGVVREIEERGLVYPVTAVDGEFLYDGAVSYPAIMRGVDARLAAAAE